MVTIERQGKTVSRSKNLRGILTYARNHGVHIAQAIPAKTDGKGVLAVKFRDGAEVATQFESYEVLRDWLRGRHSWTGTRWINGQGPF